MIDAGRAVRGLRELARLTSDDAGAQRVAWTGTWVVARDWLRGELDGIAGVTVMPAVMLFVRSLGGVSHTKAEDSPEPDIELGVRALYELTRRAIASGRG